MSNAWLTPPAIAAQLGVDVGKVYSWIATGQLIAVDLAERPDGKRRRVRIDPAELAAFLRRRQIRQPAPRQRRQREKRPAVPQYV